MSASRVGVRFSCEIALINEENIKNINDHAASEPMKDGINQF